MAGLRSEGDILRDEAEFFERLRDEDIDERRDAARDEGVPWPPMPHRAFKASGWTVPRAWFEAPDPNGWDGKDPF